MLINDLKIENSLVWELGVLYYVVIRNGLEFGLWFFIVKFLRLIMFRFECII